MGLTYHYKFEAAPDVSPERLKKFLKSVEGKALGMGFKTTLVMHAKFDSPDRMDFSRRLTHGFRVEDERLKTAVLPKDASVWHHSKGDGSASIIPEEAVFLVITDERGCELVFGFFKFPETLSDRHGDTVAETKLGGKWFFEDFLKTPDPRIRAIVKEFASAGYLNEAIDDYQTA